MTDIISTNQVKGVLISLRGEDVILASDVAKLYGVETKVINQAVKNNPDKFPEGFVFELTKEEKDKVVKNFDHLRNLKYSSSLPTVFTEQGLFMLATILKSPVATQTALAMVNNFAQVKEIRRQILAMHEIAEKMLERGFSDDEIAEILN